jgi:DNA repair photolyase
MVAPVIPALNESEIERILAAAAAAGVKEAGYVLLRLPLEVKDVFKEFLEREYPDRARHVMSVIRSMRNGKEYDAKWGERMRGNGPYAWQIGRRFEIAAKRLGINQAKRRLRTDLFVAPRPETDQLDLFGNQRAA